MNCFISTFQKIFTGLTLIIGLSFCVSCGGGDGPGEDAVSSIQLLVDYTEMSLGGTVSFSVFGNDGSNLTAASTIHVDNTPINGSSYTSNSEGTYWFYATYKDLKSTPLTVQFSTKEVPGFVHKVLIEDYTGTWCGWCPRISYAIEQLEIHTENAVVVSIHRAGDDPYKFNGSGIGDLDEGLYPTGKINRSKTWPYPENSNTDFVLNQMQNKVGIGLALDSEVDMGSIDIRASVSTTKQYSQYKLVVYLVEDGLIYNQSNYTDFYGGADPIVGFEHNNVLRAVLTDLYGEAVYPTGDEFIRDFSIPIPTNIENTDNVKVIAFVMDGGGSVLNSQVSELGVKKEYDN